MTLAGRFALRLKCDLKIRLALIMVPEALDDLIHQIRILLSAPDGQADLFRLRLRGRLFLRSITSRKGCRAEYG